MEASLLVTITCMLFEGGALIQSLSTNEQGQALATKVAAADEAAMAAGQTEFSLELNPIELGMAWTALTAGSSPLAESLGTKMRDALAAKLVELGIEYGGNGAGQGGGSVGGLDGASPIDDEPAQQPVDGQPAADADHVDESPQQGLDG